MRTKVTVKLDLDDEMFTAEEMNSAQKRGYYEKIRQEVYYPFLNEEVDEQQRTIRPDSEAAEAAVTLWTSEPVDIDLSHIEGEEFDGGVIGEVIVEEVEDDDAPTS